ncbi:MAG: glycosyltransferase family 8 protein [Candidatus Cryptobacteroides sp.]
MDNEIHIAFCFDQGYVMPTGVAMCSICANTPEPVCFHALVSQDVTDEAKEQMEGMVASQGKKIVFHVIDPSSIKGAYSYADTYISKCTYYRFLLPDVLPPEVTKVIYLDGDLIALGSLRPLWETELAPDEPAAIACDRLADDVTLHNRIGTPLSQPYFNCGVMVFNLGCWRKEGLGAICLQQSRTHSYLFMDQDAVNVLIGHRIKRLHFKYNCQSTFALTPEQDWKVAKEKYADEIHEALEQPVIMHFITDRKPWQEGFPLASEWLEYKAASPWKDIPLQKSRYEMQMYVKFPAIQDSDYALAEVVALPLITLAVRLGQRHPRVFRFFRKLVWSTAKKFRLLDKEY